MFPSEEAGAGGGAGHNILKSDLTDFKLDWSLRETESWDTATLEDLRWLRWTEKVSGKKWGFGWHLKDKKLPKQREE